MKKIILIILAMFFTGCSLVQNVTPQKIATAYGTAKLIYTDVKHIVYEVNEEKSRINEKGFGDENGNR